MKDKLEIKGRLMIKNDDKIIFDSGNLILDTGLEYLATLLAGETSSDEDEHGIESIAIGDDSSDETESQTDLVGEELEDLEITEYNKIDNEVYFNGYYENNTGSDVTHYEAVLTNNYDAGKGNRTCLSRISFGDDGSVIPDGDYVEYIWLIKFDR